MSEKQPAADRRLTRQGVRDLSENTDKTGKTTPRRSAGHSPSNPEHTKKCFLCSSSADYEAAQTKRRSRSRKSSVSSRASTSSRASPIPSSSQRTQPTATVTSQDTGADTTDCGPSASQSKRFTVDCSPYSEETITFESEDSELEHRYQSDLTEVEALDESQEEIYEKLEREHNLDISLNKEISQITDKLIKEPTGQIQDTVSVTATTVASKSIPLSSGISSSQREDISSAILASTAKSQATPPKPQVPPPQPTPSKPSAQAQTTHPSAHIPKPQIMTSSSGPMTRLQAQSIPALDGGHRQVAASNIDEGTLDQTFQITPKWHYIKSNHDETNHWLESASFEAILLELLYFAHDQGHIQQKEMEGQFEKELERAIDSIEKLDCLDAFCKTFIRDGRFRPAGKVTLSSSSKDEKHNRLFRMINADLLNLQRQHRILSMVCAGTADHEVHTQAQRENLRKLVEDLVHIVHPGDRGTLSEVYKVLTENAVYNERIVKPSLTSLKVVSHPDIVVPFGGPIIAGGSQIRCDTLEHKIRAKLPSLLIKMHFSDRLQDQKWPDFSKADDSGIVSSIDGNMGNDDSSMSLGGSSTPTGTGSASRSKGKPDDKSGKGGTSSSSSSSRAGKRKQAEELPSKSKRHREDINSGGYETQPPDAHVINEIYSEHVAQLLCSLAQSPLGYVKHCKYAVSPSDERDGTAGVSALGMIVSGEDVYLTKLDASHDYLDSLVETFRMDQLSFSCMANPLNLYKGTHLKALLMFLRYVCLNFPRTTYFLSE